MFKKKYFLLRTVEPISYIKIESPKTIPKDKKIIGYDIYQYKYPIFCFFLPICLKVEYTLVQKPIYE